MIITIGVATLFILISVWYVERAKHEKNSYYDVIENLPVMIWTMDLDLRYTYVNKSIEKYGWSEKNFIGKHFSNVGDFSTVDPVDEAIKRYKADPKNYNKQTIITYAISRITGKQIIWESHVNEHIVKGIVVGYKGASIDITARIKLEDMKMKYEKLQAAAEMSGAVCHNLSQPSTSANGSATLLKLDDPKLEYNKHFNILEKSLKRICDIILKVQTIDFKSGEYHTKPYMDTQITDFERMGKSKKGGEFCG